VLRREDYDDVTVIRFKARKLLDVEEIKLMFDLVYKSVDEMGRSKLILNFIDVEYLSSFVLGKLMVVKRKAEATGGRMVLCNVAPQIQVIFRGPGRMLFDLYENEQEALRSFTSPVAT